MSLALVGNRKDIQPHLAAPVTPGTWWDGVKEDVWRGRVKQN